MKKKIENYEYFKIIYENCNNNDDFINFIKCEYERLNKLDITLLKSDTNNKDILFQNNIYDDNENSEIIEKLKNNSLTTIRLGNVESEFLIKYMTSIKLPGDYNSKFEIDYKMRTNAGLYYKNSEDRKDVLKWYVDNFLELVKNDEVVLTSCYAFLKWDLILYSHLNISNKKLYNWELFTKVLLTNIDYKKILVISNAVDILKKSFDRNLQTVYKITLSQIDSINYIKTPQTTIGSEYIDDNIMITCDNIYNQIKLYDFDIVLLACGAYGCPISNFINKNYSSKSVIYLGSLIYTIFGIYSNGIPIPNYDFIHKDKFIEIEEKCPEHCKNIDQGKYWKV